MFNAEVITLSYGNSISTNAKKSILVSIIDLHVPLNTFEDVVDCASSEAELSN
jgi:hypothetical protein